MPVMLGGLVAFALVVGWALLCWQRSGRDPSYLDDASILLPAPPEGMTAATATIVDGLPAPTAFMAALLDLASRDEIAFRDETPDATDAHRVGIEIHGMPTDDPRVSLNRRKPVGEGEAWLLANLRSFASVGAAGFAQDDHGSAAYVTRAGGAGETVPISGSLVGGDAQAAYTDVRGTSASGASEEQLWRYPLDGSTPTQIAVAPTVDGGSLDFTGDPLPTSNGKGVIKVWLTRGLLPQQPSPILLQWTPSR